MTRHVGRYDQWVAEDQPMAEGASGKVFRCTHPTGFVVKMYDQPRRDAWQRQRIDEICQLGRRLIDRRYDRLGVTPATSLSWPVDVLAGGGATTGVVLPHIPSVFVLPSRGSRKLDTRKLDLLYLPRKHPPPAETRVRVLLRLAEVLAWLEANRWVHGDLSQNNILWGDDPEARAFLIDVDEMRRWGDPPSRGLATPGWEDPRKRDHRIPCHDEFSDRLALAWAAYRVLTLSPANFYHDGPWRPPQHYPGPLPRPIVDLLHQALDTPLQSTDRPWAVKWVDTLLAEFFPKGAPNRRLLNALDHVNERQVVESEHNAKATNAAVAAAVATAPPAGTAGPSWAPPPPTAPTGFVTLPPPTTRAPTPTPPAPAAARPSPPARPLTQVGHPGWAALAGLLGTVAAAALVGAVPRDLPNRLPWWAPLTVVVVAAVAAGRFRRTGRHRAANAGRERRVRMLAMVAGILCWVGVVGVAAATIDPGTVAPVRRFTRRFLERDRRDAVRVWMGGPGAPCPGAVAVAEDGSPLTVTRVVETDERAIALCANAALAFFRIVVVPFDPAGDAFTEKATVTTDGYVAVHGARIVRVGTTSYDELAPMDPTPVSSEEITGSRSG